ncbi:uncharacterized protein LOC143183385 [Calliopsis andreniformis]|uniref:uncharacterized protein LOC143183385 n=1 Tax=Calliopsis andreniformis TaxID=337506 RepID=UPI003FCC5E14
MSAKSNNCLEHPLGILCKCAEYQKVIDKFTFYSIGMQHPLLPKVNIEPIASAEVFWIRNRLNLTEDISKPILQYSQVQPDINACNVDKIWIPLFPNMSLRSFNLYGKKVYSER